MVSNSDHSFGEVEPKTSILFLGSGFSLGAKNIAGGYPPNGASLRRHFMTKLGLPEDTTYDLQILSGEFADDDPQKLREELYTTFRIASIDETQAAILNERWQRIYTTNYDDVVEFHRQRENRRRDDYDISQPVPNKLPHGAVVHLHGSIRVIKTDNIIKSLVLSEASYVNQYLVRSPWYDQFQRDITFASSVFIVGYSLADYHIAALLLENPDLKKRTFFIQGPDQDDLFLRRTRSYGRTLFIGTDGFAKALKEAPRPEAPTDLLRLRSFRSLNPVRDQKGVINPTAPEVYDLLVYGNFDAGRLARSQPNETYAIGRAEAVRTAADTLESCRSLVVDARLGNGKTLFLHLLAFELSKRGSKCLLFQPGHPEMAHELNALREVKNLVILIEQYSAAQDALPGLSVALPNAKFAIEVRTGTFEVRYHEFQKILPKPFDRINLNRLRKEELSALMRLCKLAGLSSEELGAKDQVELRNVLLESFKSPSIRDRIERSLAPLFENLSLRRILTMTMLISSHQGSIGTGFVRSVTGVDPFVELKDSEHLATEIFEVTADKFRVRSAIFSSFVLNTFIESEEIADAVVDVTLAAAERKQQRPYRVLMSNMMAYSKLSRLLRDKIGSMNVIQRVYERLRYDERVNGEPLYWLQSAIAMIDVPRLDLAKEHIQTAYSKAEDLPGFQTYQIDTQAFRIALLVAINEKAGEPISNIDDVLSGLERIHGMLDEESHRAYAVKVLDGIQPFVSARRMDLSSSEAIAVHLWLLKVVDSLSALPDDFKMTTGSELVRTRMQEAAKSFLSQDNADSSLLQFSGQQ